MHFNLLLYLVKIITCRYFRRILRCVKMTFCIGVSLEKLMNTGGF